MTDKIKSWNWNGIWMAIFTGIIVALITYNVTYAVRENKYATKSDLKDVKDSQAIFQNKVLDKLDTLQISVDQMQGRQIERDKTRNKP